MKIYQLPLLALAAIVGICACSKESSVVEVSELKLDQTVLELSVGDAVTLTATVLPANAGNKTVVWTSSDEAIVTVDGNGLVTAVSAGDATITATAGNASDVCRVTVAKGAFVFVPETALSAYAANAFTNLSQQPMLDEAVIWLRSADYTLEKDPTYSGNIKQTGRELQISLNVPAGSKKIIPMGIYDMCGIKEYTPDTYAPFTSFNYYKIDYYVLGNIYEDFDNGTKFIPVDGTIEIKRSTTVQDGYSLKVRMTDENGDAFACDWEGVLDFKLDTFYKYLMY